MLTRITSSFRTDQISHFVYGFLYCAWDTLELGWDVLEEIGARLVEFFVAIFNLIFQVLIFLRDLCIETMQTFANVFQGMINVISSISCEDVEDFASACIVVLLWVGVVKIIINMLSKNPGTIRSNNPCDESDSFYDEEFDVDKRCDLDGCSRKLRKRKKTMRRQSRSLTMSASNPEVDEEQSD